MTRYAWGVGAKEGARPILGGDPGRAPKDPLAPAQARRRSAVNTPPDSRSVQMHPSQATSPSRRLGFYSLFEELGIETQDDMPAVFQRSLIYRRRGADDLGNNTAPAPPPRHTTTQPPGRQTDTQHTVRIH